MMLTVFTRPLCGMCAVARRWLSELGVPFREVDVSERPEARRVLRKLASGYLSVPTLVFEDGRVLVEPGREALLRELRRRRAG